MKKTIKRNSGFQLLYVLMLLCFTTHAQETVVWQWSVALKGYVSDETQSNPTAFLWIPEDCNQIRAIVFSQQNMCEETLFEHVNFRKTMSELGFAIVWVSPGIDYQWNTATGCQDVFDNMLEDLADVSGYTEIKHAPIVPLGHSAMATFPWNFAAWNSERTLAVVSYKGDAPRTNLTGYGRENLEWGRTRNIDGIPGLMIEGEYEWWEARVNPALAFRMVYPESCISFLYDRGQGHFDVSDKVVDYISLFLRKAAKYRLPENQPLDKPVELTKINPKDGWLAERWTSNFKNRAKATPFSLYQGNEHDAFWYFDQEVAEATENYYKEFPDKEMRYITFSLNGRLVRFEASSHAQYTANVELQENLTFNIAAMLTDSSRTQPMINSSLKEKIWISKISGPVKQLNDATFVLDFYRMGVNNPRRTGDIWLLAHSEEDSRFKSVVQQINIKVPYPLDKGERQYILFPGLSDVRHGTEQVELNATSDKGLDVSYYVKEGPAKIEGNKLVFTKLPPRAKFPVKVTVVAWQYGLKDSMQSVSPAERSFYIQ
ncbi:hypothetical protein FAZ19_02615 [Sphingobacterium alkalisoli]|uniref:Alpha/beta hydrolase n=1 Tax=Sphingobacterium alkalisoli TaxID=1874115 RepID=A0A4U0H8S4_9SPHI|nr:hypothetical protein [Sphingobacterium alkalisoli]TJY68168.1 hypothetical protein FAZ19_02615 [Sphingobacterium alkalisoli]GGH08554.1 hypothetical protein GCM10011418_06070 [Sphingobacterium alkalisoli]